MISVVVLTKNEEKNIEECLKTLQWCDEIVVVDDFSTDKTVSLAKRLGAKIFERNLEDDFYQQRNFGLGKATGEWVLFIDADERVSQNLASEIREQVANLSHLPGGLGTPPGGYYIRRHDVMWGRKLKYGEWGSQNFLRFARKNAGKWARRVHEVWDVEDSTQLLESPLLHYPHQTIAAFLKDIDRYSSLHAQANLEEGKHSSILKFILYPKLKFLQNYIFKLGFLDGGQGFVVAMLMSFHSYLAWGKLWLLQQSKK